MDDGVRNKAWESDDIMTMVLFGIFPAWLNSRKLVEVGVKIRKYAENNPGRTIFVCRRQQWIIFDLIYLDGEGALSSLGNDLIGQYLRSFWVDLEFMFLDTDSFVVIVCEHINGF